MTVAAGKTPYHSYFPGAAMAAEGIPFDFGSADDLHVEDSDGDTLAYGTDYAIGGDPAEGEATITALAEHDGDVEWRLWSETPREQALDLAETRVLPLPQYERELDRRARIEREIDHTLTRAPKVPRHETIGDLPALADRLSRVAGYDGSGNPVAGPLTATLELLVTTALSSLTIGSVASVSTIAGMTALLKAPLTDGDVINVLGHNAAGDGGGGFFRWVEGDSTAEDGGTVFAADAGGTGRWIRVFGGAVHSQWWGLAGDGVTDDTAGFEDFAAFTVANGLPWEIDAGTYSLDPLAPIDFVTSGVCRGEILFQRDNANATIRFPRDAAGTVVDATAWTMDRDTLALGAANADNKVVYLSSAEILIERQGGGDYTKQELIKVLDDSALSRPMTCTYTVPGDVTATAYDESPRVIVHGLRIRLAGAGQGATLGSLKVERDNAVFADLVMEVDGDLTSATGVVQGAYVTNCFNPVFLNPVIRGFNRDGTGYGIQFSGTLGYFVHNGQISECRHAIAGRHNVDGMIWGGSYDRNIDEHWGENWQVIGAAFGPVAGDAGVHYAGWHLRVIDCTQFGGRTMVNIRSDTPFLGGRVEIVRPVWHSTGEADDVYGLLTLLNPWAGPFTDDPRMPDSVLIESPRMHTEIGAGADRFLLYIGTFAHAHVNWGTIRLQGSADLGGDLFTGVVLYTKDATYQTTRATKIEIDGSYDAGGGNLVFAVAADANNTRAASLTVRGNSTGAIRFEPDALSTIDAHGMTIDELLDDSGAAAEHVAGTRYMFRGCIWTGGEITDTIRNLLIADSTFTGLVTEFPAAGATLCGGNVTTVDQTNMPDIRNTFAAPFNLGP